MRKKPVSTWQQRDKLQINPWQSPRLSEMPSPNTRWSGPRESLSPMINLAYNTGVHLNPNPLADSPCEAWRMKVMSKDPSIKGGTWFWCHSGSQNVYCYWSPQCRHGTGICWGSVVSYFSSPTFGVEELAEKECTSSIVSVSEKHSTKGVFLATLKMPTEVTARASVEPIGIGSRSKSNGPHSSRSRIYP